MHSRLNIRVNPAFIFANNSYFAVLKPNGMAIKTLTGKWIGQYTYGKGYEGVTQASCPFEMDLVHDGFALKGTCFEEQFKDVLKAPATIEGSFENKAISFIKKYPSMMVLDQDGQASADHDNTGTPIHYTGRLTKKWFPRRYIFTGQWSMNESLDLGGGISKYVTLSGTWSMERQRKR